MAVVLTEVVAADVVDLAAAVRSSGVVLPVGVAGDAAPGCVWRADLGNGDVWYACSVVLGTAADGSDFDLAAAWLRVDGVVAYDGPAFAIG